MWKSEFDGKRIVCQTVVVLVVEGFHNVINDTDTNTDIACCR